jgi:hypothetical protein
MDTFNTFVRDLKKLPAPEKEKILDEKKTKCICPTCPTYNKCAIVEREKLFCMIGQSFLCISFEEGCKCKECPIKTEYGLEYKYYCTRGDEKGQRYLNSVWGSTLEE